MTTGQELKNYLTMMRDFRQTAVPFPKGYNYVCAEDYVLDRGRLYESSRLTEDEEKSLMGVIGEYGRPFKQRECFYNAQMLVLTDHTKTLRFAEGFAVGVIPVHHAWVTLNGKVVDLTWRVKGRRKGGYNDRIIGVIPNDRAYYGVEFDTETVREVVLQTEMSHSFLQDYRSGYAIFKEERVAPLPPAQAVAP